MIRGGLRGLIRLTFLTLEGCGGGEAMGLASVLLGPLLGSALGKRHSNDRARKPKEENDCKRVITSVSQKNRGSDRGLFVVVTEVTLT